MPWRGMIHPCTRGVGDHARSRQAASWLVTVTLAAALALAVVSTGSGSGRAPAATPSASPAASPIASPVEVSRTPTTQMIVAGHATIAITDDAMLPAHFESAVGREVGLTVVNAGSRPHNFTMAAFDIDVDLDPGETATFDLGAPTLGDYPYFSDLPGDEHLTGTMTVFI